MIIKVVSRDKGSEFFELSEHEGPVLRIDLSSDGLLASSSGDGTIKIWNLEEKKVVKTFTGFDKIKSYQATNCFGNLSLKLILIVFSIYLCFGDLICLFNSSVVFSIFNFQ